MTAIKPGIYDGMPNAQYHADPALGSTSLKTLATKTPAHYLWDREHPRHSDAFDLGTAAHSLILEGDESGLVIIEADDWKTKAAQTEKAAARAAGKVPLLTKELAQVRAMGEAVMRHPVAYALFAGHKAEQSVFWEEDGLMFKCRPDAWKPDALVDLKTTQNADPRKFGKTAADFGYFQSQAHYVDGVARVTGEVLPFVFVLVEKHAPYLVSVVELDADDVEYGRMLNERAKRIYRECVESDIWHGYPQVGPVELPRYARYDIEDLLGITSELEMEF